MCIVIDTNTLSCVFDNNCSEHSEFKPVNNWIFNDKGLVVYGGSKYKKELRKANKYYSIFIELKKINKIAEIKDSYVDKRQRQLESLVKSKKFNDSHILAIVIESNCRLICTLDKKSHNFLRDIRLYPKGMKLAKIYSNRNCKKLLCSENIVKLKNVV